MKGWALWLLLALQLVLVVWTGCVAHRLRLGKQRQDALLDELAPGAGCRWFRVLVSRPEAFARRLKWLPFEGPGLLLDTGDAVRVVANLWSGERLDWLSPRSTLQIERADGGMAGIRSHWLRLKAGGGELMVAADSGMTARALPEATAELFRTLLPGQPLPSLALGGFALDKNRASAIATSVLLALLVFAGVDAMLNEHELLSEALFVVLPLLGVLLTLPLFPLLRRHRVPTAESAGVALLMAIAMALAVVPFTKRLDQMLAPTARSVVYRLVGATSLQPLQPGLPALQFPELKEYWAQFEQGSEHAFLLVRGPLGLWQLDRSPLHEKTRAFYASHPQAVPKPSAPEPVAAGNEQLVKPREGATPAASHPASTEPMRSR